MFELFLFVYDVLLVDQFAFNLLFLREFPKQAFDFFLDLHELAVDFFFIHSWNIQFSLLSFLVLRRWLRHFEW